MKNLSLLSLGLLLSLTYCTTKREEQKAEVAETAKAVEKHLYIDVHNLEPGKVTPEAVADAHAKDLATQGKYNVNLIKYWLDQENGKVYCLSESPDSVSIYNTHKEAHGLTPDLVHLVSDGPEAGIKDVNALYFDVHKLGEGKVTAAAVADAHVKDLATQGKYGVNFVNYWVDEKLGVVMCLAEAPNKEAMVNTHKEAHGLVPDEVHKVVQGN